jgi:predicted nucleic acid-binding protein
MIATEAAQIRAMHGIKTPDSIQLATASIGGANVFLTNDSRLVSMPGMRVLVLDQLREEASQV